MPFLVIERFNRGDATPIGERFKRSGRWLPEDAADHGSWVDFAGARCLPLMEAPNRGSFSAWTARWDGLMDFEIVPVLASGEFWSEH
jgi:hypothetical protein